MAVKCTVKHVSPEQHECTDGQEVAYFYDRTPISMAGSVAKGSFIFALSSPATRSYKEIGGGAPKLEAKNRYHRAHLCFQA